MRTTTLVLALMFVVLPISITEADEAPEEQKAKDDALLEQYRNGKALVPSGFWAIHADPKAGQYAKFNDLDGIERAYRIAFVRENVCTVERQLPGSQVVVAVEFELDGLIENDVRRAWVGRLGEKPFVAQVAPVERGSGGVGLGGNSESSEEEFKNFEQGGRKWSGKLRTVKYWRHKIKKDGPPYRIAKTWSAENQWFRHPIRYEEEIDGEKKTEELLLALDESKPLLDWSEVPEPSLDQAKAIRAPIVRAANEGDLANTLERYITRPEEAGLHPGAAVGDWALYGSRRYVLAVLTDSRAVLEDMTETKDNEIAHAIEFEIIEGKAGAIVARYAGFRGEKPKTAKLSIWNDGRELAVSDKRDEEVEVAGRTWKARHERHFRKPLRPQDSGEVSELVLADDAPFGKPLRSKSYPEKRPEQVHSFELAKFGKNAKPAMDWSAWKPGWPWRAPFTEKDVKAFIKKDMRWSYRQELWNEEGTTKVTYTQTWTVSEVNDDGYKVDCHIEGDDGSKRDVSDRFTWKTYIDRIESIPLGTTEESTLKLGEREIRIVKYISVMRGRKGKVLFALSPDLPGIRIATEEWMFGDSKVWLTSLPEISKEEK